MRLVEITQFI